MNVQEASFGIIPLMQMDGIWKVLLILHKGGRHWAFPKGRSNPGETPLESAKRELKEETGLEVEKLLQDEPLSERYEFRRKSEIVVKTVQYFPALVYGEVRLQPEEIQDAKWVPLKEAVRHLTFREAKEMCRMLVRQLNL
ncbi:MAG: NUDIX domain-containing protein [Rhabdochlamydiaceae bacterium]|jgi:8-oxo-dGTP pyrophosphatase MutT (NUDIX family)